MPARFPRRLERTLFGAVALVIVIANPAAAPPGDLDTTFDVDGKVTTDFAGARDDALAVAIQGDGKIVAAGLATFGGDTDFALTRYNTDGSLDTTFDGDGRVTTDFATASSDAAAGLALQADGKIVAAGTVNISGNNDFGLARYNTDGSLDSTFDADGRVTTAFAAGADDAEAVAIQGDGKILAAGRASVSGTFEFALARYNTNGSLDSTFDADGRVTTDFAADLDQVGGVIIQGDGKIVAAGLATTSGNGDFGIARYNATGSLDTTFDGDGKVTTDIAGSLDEVLGVSIQGDGKIVAAGFVALSGNGEFGLARYDTDGSLDSAFDGDGKLTTDIAGNFDRADAVAIQGNGKILAAGHAVVSGNVDFALARYKANGTLDISFSSDGKVTTDFAGMDDVAFAVAIQANGRIVAAGRVNNSGHYDFGLARYTCLRRTSRPMSIPICP
jgi:uncharacterized delta-60 repeat protein